MSYKINKMVAIMIACISLIVSGSTGSPVVIGGKDIDIQNYPYQLALLVNNKYTCGATIIGREYALTAAQCVKGVSESKITLRAGSNKADSGGYVHKVSKVAVHEKYDQAKNLNDISLLKVSTPFDLTKPGVKAVGLPLVNEAIPTEKEAYLTGYGKTSATGIATNILHGTTFPTISDNVCKKSVPSLTGTMCCAGYTSGGRDACEGDQGSPLVFNNKLIGITSWNFSCGLKPSPIVFTKVSNYRDWIKKNSGI
ncbi:trypsin-1-like [Chrysoperla carnea]|uniref:trypsin-1-like n=1 Tax=Chrysoperla carnea TaxID=189513 RepID=UPI001D067B71|nr:trypsin-1-like [Chrysoperla carnea]